MRERKTLYFCRFSVLFFSSSETYSWNMKNNVYQIQKDRMKLFHQAFGRRKKNSQTKSFQTIHFTSHTKAKVFTFPKYSSKYFAFLVSKKHFSFVYVAPTLLQRWWLHARKNLFHWIFVHFCILMKCNAIDMLFHWVVIGCDKTQSGHGNVYSIKKTNEAVHSIWNGSNLKFSFVESVRNQTIARNFIFCVTFRQFCSYLIQNSISFFQIHSINSIMADRCAWDKVLLK